LALGDKKKKGVVIEFEKPVREVVERILLIMPEDAEACIAATAVVQAYMADLHDLATRMYDADGKTKTNYLIEVYFPKKYMEFMLENLGFVPPDVVRVFSIPSIPTDRRGYEVVFEFDLGQARSIANVCNKHITQGFGILLGCESNSVPLVNRKEEKPEFDFVLLPGIPNVEELYNLLTFNLMDAKVSQLMSEKDSLQEVVNSGDIFIGPRSAITYLAAAQGRGVIELYDESVAPRSWLSKWEASRYSMISTENLDYITPDLVYRAAEAVWQTTITSRALETATVQSTSSVESVKS
jgi:hypothetical protein